MKRETDSYRDRAERAENTVSARCIRIHAKAANAALPGIFGGIRAMRARKANGFDAQHNAQHNAYPYPNIGVGRAGDGWHQKGDTRMASNAHGNNEQQRGVRPPGNARVEPFRPTPGRHRPTTHAAKTSALSGVFLRRQRTRRHLVLIGLEGHIPDRSPPR